MTNRRPAQAGETQAAWRVAPRAFTLTELLVVISLIGLLITLLLPAVMSAREAARRASCSNNLAQLSMALHQYEAAHRVYPPGTVNPTGPVLNQLSGYHHGWFEQLLPFLEKGAVFHHIDRDVGVYHKNNMPVRELSIDGLACPSVNRGGGELYSSYAALHHDTEAAIDIDQNGVFFLNSAVGFDDVNDGVSYTFFLGEKLNEVYDLGWMSGTRATLRNTGEEINVAVDQIRQAGRWANMHGLPRLEVAAETDDQGAAFGQEIPFGRPVVTSGTTPRTLPTFVGGFASDHEGGANFAMGDGSVRLVADTITTLVYRRLGNRRDGHLINDSF